jgi:P27 family predicted phage terminase small subunit
MCVSAPEHLSPEARAVWAATVARKPGCEGPDLEAYCVQVSRMRDAQARIDREGIVVADAKGNPIPHPALAIEKSAQVEVRAWSERFKAAPPVVRRR